MKEICSHIWKNDYRAEEIDKQYFPHTKAYKIIIFKKCLKCGKEVKLPR